MVAPSIATHRRMKAEMRLLALIVEGFAEFDSCWMWGGLINADGYGTFNNKLAHRLVYERFAGPIPAGLVLDHLCSVRACVSPWHLEPVTPGENARRSSTCPTTINRNKTHCIRGHALIGDNLHVSTRADGEVRRTCRICRRMREANRRRRRKAGPG